MGTTPIYAFPYPGVGDSPHGPNQIQGLAEAVETSLAAEATTRAAADTAAAAASHAYYYQSGTPQNIPSASDQRVLFNSNQRTTSDITTATVSGGTEFTIAKAGVWLINTTVKFDTSANDTERYLAIANSAALTTRYGQDSGPSNTATSSLPIGVNVSVCRPFAVGAKICALVFQGSAGTVALLNNYVEDVRIDFTFMGN